MKNRPLGRTGLYVSPLCLGTMTFGGQGFWKAIGTLGETEVDRIVGSAFDAGINFLDTANVYSEGESERLVGAALKRLGRARDSYVLATKVRGRMGAGSNQVGLSRYHIMHSIDASLARLGLDHVDLYQIHGVDPTTPLEETLEALNDLVRTGKVRYLGLSNLPAWMQMKALAIQERRGWSRFVSAQMYYSIAGRDLEREVVPLAIDQGLGILPWSPLAGGLLSGKFDLEAEDAKVLGARRSEFDFPPVDRTRAAACLRAMRPIATAHGTSVARIALAWLLHQPHVTSVIIGAKSDAQLADNLGATEIVLTADELATLDAASALPAEYPGWMIGFQNRDPR
ncbi:MAG: aldo/keto reductase [Deltaproteobacteria bacterium]|nr:aldo/keto reductase [Deltaproteobacteria bacterium]